MNEPNAPTYQLYECSRGDWVAWAAAESVKLPELPDFLKYQSRFSRLRLLMRGCKKALSISEVKVDPLTLTNSNKKFFIFDFDGKIEYCYLHHQEDLCKSFVEDPDVAEEQASIVTSMPETPVFDNNNNCVNYSTSQLKMIYQSDTPVIGASSTINLTKSESVKWTIMFVMKSKS